MNNNKFYFNILIISAIVVITMIVSKLYIYIIGKILLGFSSGFIISSLMNIKNNNKKEDQ